VNRKRLPQKIAATLLFCIALSLPARSQTWQRLGPEGGIVVSMVACPDGTDYLGTPDGHVFASPAAAGQPKEKWQLRGRVAGRTDTVIARLLCDPLQTNVLYAAVWFQEINAGGGIFRSADQGRNWEPLGLHGEAVRTLELAPQNRKSLSLARAAVFSVPRTRGKTGSAFLLPGTWNCAISIPSPSIPAILH
jgi:hypothetical protein